MILAFILMQNRKDSRQSGEAWAGWFLAQVVRRRISYGFLRVSRNCCSRFFKSTVNASDQNLGELAKGPGVENKQRQT